MANGFNRTATTISQSQLNLSADNIDFAAVFIYIKKHFGLNVLRDEGKLNLYLMDLIPQMQSEQQLIRFFTQCRGNAELVDACDVEPEEYQRIIQSICKRMTDGYMIQEQKAMEICMSFAAAVSRNAPIQKPQPTTDVMKSGRLGSHIEWRIKNDGILELSGSGLVSGGNVPWDQYKHAIQSIVISEGITSLEKGLFAGCSQLKTVTFPKSLTVLEDAFTDCCGLTTMKVPANVKELKASPNCSSLTNVEVDTKNQTFMSENGLVYRRDGRELIWCPGGVKGEITIRNGVETIAEYAMAGCAQVAKIQLPESLRNIQAEAFSGCDSLTVLRIPIGVRNVCWSAFDQVKNIMFGGPCPNYTKSDRPLAPLNVHIPRNEDSWQQFIRSGAEPNMKFVLWDNTAVIAAFLVQNRIYHKVYPKQMKLKIGKNEKSNIIVPDLNQSLQISYADNKYQIDVLKGTQHKTITTESDHPTVIDREDRIAIMFSDSGKPSKVVPLPQNGTIYVGRSEKVSPEGIKNDIITDYPFMGRYHFKVVKSGNKIQVFDLGSVNGLFLNGRKIVDASLRPGDVLSVLTLRIGVKDDSLVFDNAGDRVRTFG